MRIVVVSEWAYIPEYPSSGSHEPGGCCRRLWKHISLSSLTSAEVKISLTVEAAACSWGLVIHVCVDCVCVGSRIDVLVRDLDVVDV